MTYRFTNAGTDSAAHRKRVVVVGAAGATGQLAVQAALAAGHQVTACLTEPEHLPLRHDHLRLVRADVLVPGGLNGVLEGQDAVLCLVGHKREALQQHGPWTQQVPVGARATRNLVSAMAAADVKRLVMLGAAGTGDSRHTGRLGLGVWAHWLFPTVMEDKERQEVQVRLSGLQWTVVRPGRLSHGAASGQVQIGERLHWGWHSTSREDVAALMVRLIDDPWAIGKSLTVV